MLPRFHLDQALAAGLEIDLPDSAARHVQVLRLQPGAPITLFNGQGGQWQAEVLAMQRKHVSARVLVHEALDCELATPVTLALGMPANERMDWLVEKATELGVAAIVPLVCERSVLRLADERAERKAAHWQAIALAACEQSGRNRVPQVTVPQPLRQWLAGLAPAAPAPCDDSDKTPSPTPGRWLLSLAPGTLPLAAVLAQASVPGQPVTVLSGPEGGLSTAELALAQRSGFVSVTLGPRVLRADTAPLAVLATLACR